MRVQQDMRQSTSIQEPASGPSLALTSALLEMIFQLRFYGSIQCWSRLQQQS